MDPIIGVRYLCWVKNYDACQACFEKRNEIGMGGQNWKVYKKAGLWKTKVMEEGKVPPTKKAEPKTTFTPTVYDVKHPRVKCSNCDQNPILGTRYLCWTKNVNLCPGCFDKRADIGFGSENWKVYAKANLWKTKVMEEGKAPAPKKTEAPKVVPRPAINPAFVVKHARVKCKNCESEPIIGKRYYCVTKPNYDLCEECFDKRNSFGMGRENWKVYHKPGLMKEKINEKSAAPPQMKSQAAPQKKVNPAFIVKHARVKCKSCESEPIIGKRYYCVTKPNYDLCEDCFEKRNSIGMGGENWKVYHKPGLVKEKINEKSAAPPQMKSQAAPQKKVNPAFIVKHARVKCKNCESEPIIGKRYYCVTKPNYDLCEDCFEKRNSIGMGGENWKVYHKPGLVKEKINEKSAAPPQMKSQAAPQKSVSPAFVVKHARVKCKSCESEPIIGKRYYCVTKPNYDLCEDCFEKRNSIGMGRENWKVYHKPGMVKEKINEKPPEMKGQAAPQKKVNPAFIVKHARVTCKNCNSEPIIGKRYYCVTKPNYDLCEDCFDKRNSFGMGGENWKVYHKPGMVKEKINEKPPEMKGQAAPQKKTTPAFVVKHARVTCKNCNSEPIIGKRYYCVTKPNYDLCEDCFDKRNSFGMGGENWKVYHKPGLVKEKINEKSGSSAPPQSQAAPQKKKVNPAFIVKHARVKCKSCESEPIIGNRYYCVTIPNYDLCEDCFEKRNSIGMGGENWKVYHKPGMVKEKINEKVVILTPHQQRVKDGDFKSIFKGHDCHLCGKEPLLDHLYKCTFQKSSKLCDECFENRNENGYKGLNWIHYIHPSQRRNDYGSDYIEPEIIRERLEHEDTQCDICKMSPIKGEMYRCTTGEDTSGKTLCANCFDKRTTTSYGGQDWSFKEYPGSDTKVFREYQIWKGVDCSHCKMSPIINSRRYKCVTSAEDYSLCGDCFYLSREEVGMVGHNWEVYETTGTPKIKDVTERISFEGKCSGCGSSDLANEVYKCQTQKGTILCASCFPTKREKGHNWEKCFGVSTEFIWERVTFRGIGCEGCGQKPIYFERWGCTSRTGLYSLCGGCFEKRDPGHNWQQYLDWEKKGKFVKEMDFKANCCMCKKKIEDVCWTSDAEKKNICAPCFKSNRPKGKIWRKSIFPGKYIVEADFKHPDCQMKFKSCRKYFDDCKEWEIKFEGGSGSIKFQRSEIGDDRVFYYHLTKGILQVYGRINVDYEEQFWMHRQDVGSSGNSRVTVSASGGCRRWKSYKSETKKNHSIEVKGNLHNMNDWIVAGQRFKVTGDLNSYKIEDNADEMFVEEKIALLFAVIWAEEIKSKRFVKYL